MGCFHRTFSVIKLLNYLISQSGNCVNLGRTIKSQHPELYDYCLENTTFLENKVKFNERVYCLINGITSPQLDADGKPARFINLFKGYSLLSRSDEKRKAGNLIREKKESLAKLQTQRKESQDLQARELAAAVGSSEIEVGYRILKHIKSWPINHGKGLYSDETKVEGVDYLFCPITGLRKTSIRSNYTKLVLGLTIDEYLDLVGKDFPLIAPGHGTKISQSLQEIDPDTGLTKHALSKAKSVETLRKLGEDGKTGYQRLADKTRATHMANIDEHGRNGYQRIAINAIIKGNKTKQERGIVTSDEDKSSYSHYKNLVHYLTKGNRSHLDLSSLGRAGTPGATHIDHKYSIMQGFKDKVSPLLIGHKENLELLEWRDNVSKQADCSIELEELCTRCSYTMQQSTTEFEILMQIIEAELDNSLSAGILLEKFNNATKLQR